MAKATAEGLERIGKVLGLKKGTPDYTKFHDLSAQGRDKIPADVERIVKENDLLPAMLRTVEYEKVTKQQLRGIIEDLEEWAIQATIRREPSEDPGSGGEKKVGCNQRRELI